MRKYLQYLKIKNVIISMLLTVMYLRWLVEGLHPVKVAVACVAVFIAILCLFGMADKCYIKANKMSASADTKPNAL